jgi:stearoyl-CoA desaturase (delta-9 desaturase)
MIFRIPIDRINWTTSAFLIGTFVLTLTAVPLYLWYFGVDWFYFAIFAVLLVATGFSIPLGYHRLFSHATFRARLPVRLFALIFGAAAFENSVLMWASDHRRHHKHVDHDEDPYDISKGFFHGHIGWLLFKLVRPSPAAVDLVTESMFALRSSAVTAAVAPRREASFASDNPRATSHI